MNNATMRQLRKKMGFTLVEILVAVSIVILLATVGMVSYSAAGRGGRDAKRKADVEQLRSAVEIYKSENGFYPTESPSCVAQNLAGTYINPYPTDPKPTYTYCYDRISNTQYRICAGIEAGGVPTLCSAGSCGSDIACGYQVTNP